MFVTLLTHPRHPANNLAYKQCRPGLVAAVGRDNGTLAARKIVDLCFNWRKVGGGQPRMFGVRVKYTFEN